MFKSELRQISAPPLINNTDSRIKQQNQLKKNDKRTIEIGPWNSQNEKENDYSDAELSLSKYNTGFQIQNAKNSINKNMKKPKKRSISSITNQQTSNPLYDQSFQFQRKYEESANNDNCFQQVENENTLENLTYESKTVNLNNIVENQKNQQRYENESQLAKSMFLSSLKMSQYLQRQINIKKQQEDLTNNLEPTFYITKTEPSQTPPPLDKSTNIIKNQQIQKNNKNQMRNTYQSIPFNQNYQNFNFNILEPIKQRKRKEDNRKIQYVIYKDPLNKHKTNQNQYIIGQFNDKQFSQSCNIDNNTEQKNLNKSVLSPSFYQSNVRQKNQIIDQDAQTESKIGENNQSHINMKQLNSSMKSTPEKNSPKRVDHLFQLSANPYFQYDQSQYLAKEIFPEEMNNKNDLQQFQSDTKKFLHQTHNIFPQYQNKNLSQNKTTVGNNQFFSSFSRILPTQTSENEEQLRLTQNHLRVSHYQTTHFNKSQYNEQSSCLQNNNTNESILKEISITANSNLNNFKKYIKSSGLKFENNDLITAQKIINHDNNSYAEKRKSFLQNCIANCNIILQNQTDQTFSKSKNSFNQINNKSNNINEQYNFSFYNEPETNQNQKINNHCNSNLLNDNNTNSQLVNPIQQDTQEESSNPAIYRKEVSLRNKQNVTNNLSAPIHQNQSKKFNEYTNQNSRSVFTVPKKDIYQKIGAQFYTKNNKIRRQSCSPAENFGQQENTKYIKKIINEINLEKCKNLQELHQSVQIIKSQVNNINNNYYLPKLNPSNQLNKH